MSKFKMIAIDLDDTLLDDDLKVSRRNRQALGRAAELGVKVTIATGRMFRSARPLALELGIEVPIITYQGALIKNAISGKVLRSLPVPVNLAREVLAEGYRAGVHMNVYIGDELYVDSITPEGKGYAKLAKVDMFTVGNLLDFVNSDPTKLLFIVDPVSIDRLQAQLQAKLGGRLYITKSKPNYLEFLHPQATKKHGLQVLAKMYGIREDEILAIGDSYNDLDMLEYAGMGVAMGNAPDDVKHRADYVTDTNNKDGVALVVEKCVLGETV